MDTKPLDDRELKRLAKLDGKLARGLLRHFLFGTGVGFLGGLAWVGAMMLMAPGFGQHMQFHKPTGGEQHPLLELVLYVLVTTFGAVPGICLLAGTMFGAIGAAGALFGWLTMTGAHAPLARRALAHGQFQPRYGAANLLRA